MKKDSVYYGAGESYLWNSMFKIKTYQGQHDLLTFVMLMCVLFKWRWKIPTLLLSENPTYMYKTLVQNLTCHCDCAGILTFSFNKTNVHAPRIIISYSFKTCVDVHCDCGLHCFVYIWCEHEMRDKTWLCFDLYWMRAENHRSKNNFIIQYLRRKQNEIEFVFVEVWFKSWMHLVVVCLLHFFFNLNILIFVRVECIVAKVLGQP
jgi:hypothetical protein